MPLFGYLVRSQRTAELVAALATWLNANGLRVKGRRDRRALGGVRRRHAAAAPVHRAGPETQAALLRLDPVADREEYAELAAILAQRSDSLAELATDDRPDARRLQLRIRNLGVEAPSTRPA